MPVSPDLVVEVVSPSNIETEVAEKVQIYLERGGSLVFVVRPRLRAVTVHALGRPPRVLGEGDALDFGDVLPELRLAVADIFR